MPGEPKGPGTEQLQGGNVGCGLVPHLCEPLGWFAHAVCLFLLPPRISELQEMRL